MTLLLFFGAVMSSAIQGVTIRELDPHSDNRGSLYEMYRNAWAPTPAFEQWNIVHTAKNTLRGVHVHPRHSDYLHLIQGQMVLALHDFRAEDESERTTEVLLIDSDTPRAVFIPPGVCHGFYFPVNTTYVYGLSHGWQLSEELGCRYDDPALNIDWPCDNPVLSKRDEKPGTSYKQMRDSWLAHNARVL